MNTFWKPKKTKVTSIRQSYWKQKKVPIFKQRNDDARMGVPAMQVPSAPKAPIVVGFPKPSEPNMKYPSAPAPNVNIDSMPRAKPMPTYQAPPGQKYVPQPLPVTPKTPMPRPVPLPITPDTKFKAQPLQTTMRQPDAGRQIPTPPKGTHWETVTSAKGGVERRMRVLVDSTGKPVREPTR